MAKVGDMDWDMIVKQLTDTEAMILTVYGEARGESIEGQVAVMNVIMNRTRLRGMSIKGVCLQAKQFSCWNNNDPNYPVLKEMAEQAIIQDLPKEGVLGQISYLCAGVISQYLKDNTKGADHYMTTSLYNSSSRPSWANAPKTKPIAIGNHTFLQV